MEHYLVYVLTLPILHREEDTEKWRNLVKINYFVFEEINSK